LEWSGAKKMAAWLTGFSTSKEIIKSWKNENKSWKK
jgi:hypothetical protein